MSKPTKKVSGLLRRFLWQPIPWYGKIMVPFVVAALAVYFVGWVVDLFA